MHVISTGSLHSLNELIFNYCKGLQILITFGNDTIKLWIFAALAAAIISCIDTLRLLSPYAMFSAMVRSNKTGSCWTTPNCLLSRGSVREVRVSRPSNSYKYNYNKLFIRVHSYMITKVVPEFLTKEELFFHEIWLQPR